MHRRLKHDLLTIGSKQLIFDRDQKLITFALTIITTGAGGAAGAVVPMTVQFSQQQLARIIGIFGLNFLTQKASTEFGSASEMQEFNALSSLVEKLNASLLNFSKSNDLSISYNLSNCLFNLFLRIILIIIKIIII